VQDFVQPALSAWESYYVIVGSSAAALTGLQFVVMALIADLRRRSSNREIDAFGTPNVYHFCSALFVSAVLSAPWSSLGKAALTLGLCGLVGVGYALIVARRASRQTGYQPVLEDWIWHTALPLVAYATLLGSSFALVGQAPRALFPIGAAALLLVFIGIHNAWDTVTYLTVTRPQPGAGEGAASAESDAAV
jgi:hypothetical protein